MTDANGRSATLQTELSETYRSVVELTNELEQAKERLTEISFHDSLTGLPNRMLFQERVGQALAVAEREQRQLPMMLMDLDGFKAINDSLGHDLGDHVLREVALRLSNALRKSDTVARLGGDEFAVLLTTGNGVEGAVGAAEKLLEALARPIEVAGNKLSVGASIGIAWYPDHGLDYATVLKHADIAMYEAKQRGNGYAAFETHHAGQALSRLVLASELHEAIAGGGLELHFQPKVNMPSGSVIGLEALVRWRHPERGLLPPSAFVALAEQTGAAWGLSLAVLDMALAETSLRRAARSAPIGINVSASILRNPHLVDEIAARLERADMAPQDLLLEIREGGAPRDVEADCEVIQRLADMGVSVAIDDFGFGHSSLANLRELPIHELKIDRSFVANAIQRKADSAITRCIVELGQSLGIRVVAEGVENEETWRLLSNFGCENAQGYLIARPMPAPEMEKWLRTAGRRAFPRPAPALPSGRAASA